MPKQWELHIENKFGDIYLQKCTHNNSWAVIHFPVNDTRKVYFYTNIGDANRTYQKCAAGLEVTEA